jgi:HSP20 family molecular chaperone IbpA
MQTSKEKKRRKNMLTVYRDPFSMFKDLNSALDEIWSQDVKEHVDFSAKLSQDNSNFYLKTIMPGFKQQEINVEVKDGVLTINAQHANEEKTAKSFRTSTSTFKKSWKIPKNVNVDSVTADYKSGVLVVSMPKMETKESVKKVTVTCSE